jgi:hypothetical protein
MYPLKLSIITLAVREYINEVRFLRLWKESCEQAVVECKAEPGLSHG